MTGKEDRIFDVLSELSAAVVATVLRFMAEVGTVVLRVRVGVEVVVAV